MPSVLLYDWDNTLVDAWGGITAALNITFSAFDMPHWTEDDARQRVRLALSTSFQAMFGADWQRARDIFHAAMRERHLWYLRPMPGADLVLEAGRRWVQGVVSNKDSPFLKAEIASCGWQNQFRVIVGAGDTPRGKPDPAPIHLALKRLGVDASPLVWYIGDTRIDMQAAREARVTGVLIGDASHDGGIERAAPDLHFPSASALAEHLRSLA